MNRLFLYRLFKHSKPGFVLLLLFMICYGIVFYKKMDMLFFPYNGMYSIDFTKSNTATTYAMKVNGALVKISHNLYWKKDFLETSLYGYCRYVKNDRRVFLAGFLDQRYNGKLHNILMQGLTPDKTQAMKWPQWYMQFAGYEIPAHATIELMQYDFHYETARSVITDSISIYKTILP